MRPFRTFLIFLLFLTCFTGLSFLFPDSIFPPVTEIIREEILNGISDTPPDEIEVKVDSTPEISKEYADDTLSNQPLNVNSPGSLLESIDSTSEQVRINI